MDTIMDIDIVMDTDMTRKNRHGLRDMDTDKDTDKDTDQDTDMNTDMDTDKDTGMGIERQAWTAEVGVLLIANR